MDWARSRRCSAALLPIGACSSSRLARYPLVAALLTYRRPPLLTGLRRPQDASGDSPAFSGLSLLPIFLCRPFAGGGLKARWRDCAERHRVQRRRLFPVNVILAGVFFALLFETLGNESKPTFPVGRNPQVPLGGVCVGGGYSQSILLKRTALVAGFPSAGSD
jgi:hypothetical protein